MNRITMLALIALTLPFASQAGAQSTESATPAAKTATGASAPAAPAAAGASKPSSAQGALAPAAPAAKTTASPGAPGSGKVATAPGAVPTQKVAMSQQDRMRTCNKQATGKKGPERKTFMKSCLSNKPA